MAEITREIRSKGLRHPDVHVRSNCLWWFSELNDPNPDVADATLSMIEKYGWEDSFEFAHLATLLPLDEENFHRCLAQLSELEPTEDPLKEQRPHFQLNWLLQAPLSVLVEHKDQIAELSRKNDFNGRLDELLDTIERLYEIQELPPEALRDLLESLLRDCAEAEGFPILEVNLILEMIPALAASAAISDRELKQWLAHTPDDADFDENSDFRLGVALMIETERGNCLPVDRILALLAADWEWTCDLVADMLKKNGTEEVMGEITKLYPKQSWPVKLYLGDIYDRICFDGVEDALLELLEQETEWDLRAFHARSLAMTGTERSLETAYQVYLEDPEDAERIDIVPFLYASRVLLGQEDKECREWGEFLTERMIHSKEAMARYPTLESFIDDNLEFFYDPSHGPDPDYWQSLDDLDKQGLVAEFVETFESDIEGHLLHSMMHVVVENQISLGDETPVAAIADRLMGEGLSRHEMIHAIGSVLHLEISEMMSGGEPVDNERYYKELAELSAAHWMEQVGIVPAPKKSSFSDFSPPVPIRRESPKIGRNDPCPCGSGKKYKNCCIHFAN